MNEALLRGRRLQSGKCPEHGVVLTAASDLIENGEPVGTVYGCTEKGCEFRIDARNGSRLKKLLR